MMMPRKKRRAILISVIVVILIIIVAIFVALYMTTDMFKSNKVLFSKYTMQLLDNMNTILSEEHMTEVEEMLKNNKLSSDTIASIEYTENGDTSNPVNTVQMNISGEKEETAGYDYKNITLTQNEGTIFGFEYIEDENMTGIRLDGIRQYLSTNIDNKDSNELNILYDIMHTDIKELLTLTEEEARQLKDKYLEMIMNQLENANFSKQRGVTVEINGSQYNTNVYSITLTKEQFNNIYIGILENLQQETILLSKLEEVDNIINQCYEFIQNGQTSNLRQEFIDTIEKNIQEIQNSNIGNDERTISVFEADGVAISLSIDTEENLVGIDVVNANENHFINVLGNEKTETEEAENRFDFKIQKTAQKNNEETTIDYTVVEEGKETTNQCILTKKMENSNVNTSITLSRAVGENQLEVGIEQKIQAVNEFKEKEELIENENNIIFEKLNDEQKENVINNIEENATNQINAVLQVVPWENIQNMLINVGLMQRQAEDISSEGTITELERTRFNSNFEFFEGENITKERVQELIELVKGDLGDIRITQYEEQTGGSQEKIPLQYRIVVERNTDNSELAENFINYIEEGRYNNFSVTLEYDETTGLVNNIYVTVMKD